jgi:hypothetical protein
MYPDQVSQILWNQKKKYLVAERWKAVFENRSNSLSQAVLDILKLLASLGNTIFVDTLTEICILSKVSNMIPNSKPTF